MEYVSFLKHLININTHSLMHYGNPDWNGYDRIVEADKLLHHQSGLVVGVRSNILR